jgi:cytochrome c556
MNITYYIIGALAGLFILVGCKPADSTSSEADSRVSQQIEKVEVATREAIDDLSNFTHDQKDAFVERFETQLANLNKGIDELAAKIANASRAVQEEARPRLQELRAQSSQLGEELEKVKAASESTWESVKSSANQAFNDIKAGLVRTREWMSEKIAP